VAVILSVLSWLKLSAGSTSPVTNTRANMWEQLHIIVVSLRAVSTSPSHAGDLISLRRLAKLVNSRPYGSITELYSTLR